MRLPDYQPSMPRPKLFLFLFLLGIGVVLLIALVRRDVFTNERILGTLTGIMTTLLIISATELIPELARWVGNFSQRGRFKRLFGEYAYRDDVRLIFPYRYIDERKVGEDPFSTYQEVPSQNRPVPEGVVNWLAAQDIRAAVYVSNTIGEMTGKRTIALHDKDIVADPKDYCIISFGLGFTNFTHYVEGLFGQRLFKVEWVDSPKHAGIFTDAFSIKGEVPPIPEGDDIALLARVVPPRRAEREASRVWFVCAGRSAPGTAAAGFFLAYRWNEILRLYQEARKDVTKDSLVVVLRHRDFQESKISTLEFDESVEILKVNDKPLVNWIRLQST